MIVKKGKSPKKFLVSFENYRKNYVSVAKSKQRILIIIVLLKSDMYHILIILLEFTIMAKKNDEIQRAETDLLISIFQRY